MVSLKNPYDFDESDIYHNFRFYDERMRSWIHNVPEGGSAFDNDDILNRPHKVINNQIIENVNKMVINILDNAGIRLHHVFIQEMIC